MQVPRRTFMAGLGVVAALALQPAPALAQAAPALIAYLDQETKDSNAANLEAFRVALAALGHVEGENVAIVEYYAVGDTSRYPSLAAEIVGLAPDAIVATIGGAAALREVTQTIPIVLRAGNIAELLQNGLIESVGRPGGSVTGIVSADAGDRIQKRVEVAHDIVPGARRFALVIEATQARREFFEENSFAAAAKQGVDMFVVDFGGPEDFGAVFETLAREGAEVAVVAGSAIIATNGTDFAARAVAARLPAVYATRGGIEDGLATFTTHFPEGARLAARHVAEILEGADPGELAMEILPPSLRINLRAAAAIGLTFPLPILSAPKR